ncbi:class I SAM-dependent methyltransferase [Halococcoides cellulosivorans]|uniref:Methyltransferase domain-containing protein n=1 Tax=Halococcoides cellulosivorans TaxID=1679096 RepID=A0A2R4X338_9EURY|nr:class I SAM-dependent methyltransferase [Halococcoides cellulosivorans]AWB28210.1 hypothetical protein HARCEL1_11095 [Halococcoides cellulosivorans]
MISRLVEQSRRPDGLLGRVLLCTMGLAHRRLTAWGLEQVDLGADDTVLDVGCGGGGALDRLSQSVTDGHLHGLDLSRTALTKARRMTQADDATVRLTQGTVSTMPFPDERFDMVTAFQTHYHWPALDTDLAEIYRVLRQGGRLLIVGEKVKLQYHLEDYETTTATADLLDAVGFSESETVDHPEWLCVIGVR